MAGRVAPSELTRRPRSRTTEALIRRWMAVLGGAALAAFAWGAASMSGPGSPRLPYNLPASLVDGSAARSPRSCPSLVAAPVALQHGSKFRLGDLTASAVDAERAAQEEQAVEPVRRFNRIVATSADGALRYPNERPAFAECLLNHLDHWAKAGALTGSNSQQGEFEKKWGAITYSFGFAETKDLAGPGQRERIARWLLVLGRDVRREYEQPPGLSLRPHHRANNHAYWAALSAAAVGIATDDRALFGWGMSRFATALSDINDAGLLPLELRRGPRALEYHRFALEPLLMLALIARANDLALPPGGEAALKRLIATVRQGNESPALFQHLTGIAQIAIDDSPRNIWVWAEMAQRLFPDLGLESRIAPHRPYVRTWLGGDLTLRLASPGR